MVAIAGIATPSFWLGIMSMVLVLDITYLATGQAWLPPIDYVPFWQDPLRNLSMVLLPAITVGYRYSAVTMRLTRSAMLEVLREDYIRTARAKGLLEQIIVNRHALKNALLPVVTLIGIEFAFLIGGLVVTEQVFNLNGIGRLLVQAVQNQDNVLAQALVMLVVAVFVRRQPRGRRALRLARSADPLLVRASTMTVIDPAPPSPPPADELPDATRSPLGARPRSSCRRQPLGTVGLVIVLVMFAAGVFADWIAPYDPEENDFAAMMEAPSWAHLLGTDQLGRDIFSRLVFGARTALIVGFSAGRRRRRHRPGAGRRRRPISAAGSTSSSSACSTC